MAPAPAAQRAANPAEAAAVQLVRGDTAGAISSFTAALNDTSLSNDRRATLLNDRGVAYARAGQVKLAVEDFNSAATLFPEYAAIYNNRGNLLVSLGLLKEAMKDLDRAILLAPGYASAYNNRASLHVRLGQLGDAIADYTKAVQLAPQSPAPLSGRGRAHLALLRPHAATRDFTRAVNADARFAQGYRNRAEAKLMTAAYDQAIEDLSRAVAFDVSNPEIYVLRGHAYLAVRDIPAAIKDFSQAIAIDARHGTAYEGRGLAYARSDSFEQAFADLNRAIEIDPRSAEAFATRAFVYKQTGQVGVGQKDIETALKLDAKNAHVFWAKAEIEEAVGHVDQAIADVKQALAIHPGHRDAAEILQRLAPVGLNDGADLIANAGLDPWRVLRRGAQYVAVSDELPRLEVPLEMLGEGAPRILDWEIKPPPHDTVGLLKFSGGALKTSRGSEDTEMAALVDLEQQRVLTIVPQRQGKSDTTWTFDDSRISVAAIDGFSEEFPLQSASLAGAALGAGAARRLSRPDGNKPYSTGWAPWNDPLAGPVARTGQPKPAKSTQKKRKPKTLFDLLFN